jgi:hypothetical protein
MSRPTLTDRLRATLRPLLRAHGVGAALAKFSQARPGGARINPQEISYFLNRTPGRKGLTLDDLDDVAAFFGLSIGQLFGVDADALSPDETRIVTAFRACAPATREHVVGLLEMLSTAATVAPSPLASRPHPAAPIERLIRELRARALTADDLEVLRGWMDHLAPPPQADAPAASAPLRAVTRRS